MHFRRLFRLTLHAGRIGDEEIEVHEYARQLLERNGDKAIVIAANKARVFAEKGDSKESATWRHIEAALKLMRGPNQS